MTTPPLVSPFGGQPPLPQLQQQAQAARDVNTASLCRIGQETVQDIVLRTMEIFQLLRNMQLPNGVTYQPNTHQDRLGKLQEHLRMLSVLFRKLRLVYDKCNENCAGMESIPPEQIHWSLQIGLELISLTRLLLRIKEDAEARPGADQPIAQLTVFVWVADFGSGMHAIYHPAEFSSLFCRTIFCVMQVFLPSPGNMENFISPFFSVRQETTSIFLWKRQGLLLSEVPTRGQYDVKQQTVTLPALRNADSPEGSRTSASLETAETQPVFKSLHRIPIFTSLHGDEVIRQHREAFSQLIPFVEDDNSKHDDRSAGQSRPPTEERREILEVNKICLSPGLIERLLYDTLKCRAESFSSN
ncbi:hypothetical protein JOQ06_015734 [Pogonophryne albipinna]|uniref:Mediator of RNA polymerase II transcription subunit 30 n=1 Tax=Pogonophryne albipinna TaxID=1090488 RepID=A0AAD6AMS3_9TELE|nr:hypothetical protein JOQ06_015734 [Pogonophryne albipinna]